MKFYRDLLVQHEVKNTDKALLKTVNWGLQDEVPVSVHDHDYITF